MFARSSAVGAAGVLALVGVLVRFDSIICESSLKFGTVNGTVTLSPPRTKFDEIMWKKEKNKVAEWESRDFNVTVYLPFIGRVILNTTLGDLIIFNLTPSDEGEYEIESRNLLNGMKFNLTILDPLPSPTVHCTLNNESIQVQCEVPESYSRYRDQLGYSWHYRSSACEESSEPHVAGAHNPTVLCDKRKADLSEEVQCFVANSESNRSSSVVLSTCIPVDNSRSRYGLLSIPLICLLLVGFLKKVRNEDTKCLPWMGLLKEDCRKFHQRKEATVRKSRPAQNVEFCP